MKILLPGEEIYVLDAKDRKLLSQLSLNARIPATVLARKTRMNQDTVRYRLDRLREHNVLAGARALLDVSSMGYASYHLFAAIHDPERKIALMKKVEKNANALLEFAGSYTIEIAIRVKNVLQAGDVLSIVQQYADDVILLQLTETIKSTALPSCLTRAKMHHVPGVKGITTELSEEDHALLRAVVDGAANGIGVVADRVHLTRDQVAYRLRKLETSGVIQAYLPVINYASLGYQLYAILAVSRSDRLSSLLQNDEAVLWATKTVGPYDVLLYVLISKPHELVQFIARIASEVKSYQLLLGVHEHKYTYAPADWTS